MKTAHIKNAASNFKLRALFTSVLISALFLSSSCSVNPASGMPNLVLMSESKELKLGKELHEKILASTPIVQDEKLQAYIDHIGQKIVAISHRPKLKFTFTIIDSPDINAFAIPGGYVYINRGLIAYLQSEAELAAVLAHEVGHVTARHSVKQDTARKGSTAVTIASVFATGSTAIADVADLWGTAAVMGYGRDMELEADSLAAEYLVAMQYSPNAMIEVIGTLKDQEKFSRRMAKDSGKKAATYHGVFSSHPRNDTRLQEVIAKAGELANSEATDENRAEFRKQTEGMLFGINYAATIGSPSAATPEKNTYLHSKLGFAIDFPLGWQAENQRSQIVSIAEDKHAQLAIGVIMLKEPTAPDALLRQRFKTSMLKQSEAISQFGLLGHTGIIPASASQAHPHRVAVLYQGRRAYTFSGLINNSVEDEETDTLLLNSIRSFRPQRVSRKPPAAKTIHYVKANAQTTYARLAQTIKLGKYTEAQLRLINDDYPRGEPKSGQWLKIIK